MTTLPRPIFLGSDEHAAWQIWALRQAMTCANALRLAGHGLELKWRHAGNYRRTKFVTSKVITTPTQQQHYQQLKPLQNTTTIKMCLPFRRSQPRYSSGGMMGARPVKVVHHHHHGGGRMGMGGSRMGGGGMMGGMGGGRRIGGGMGGMAGGGRRMGGRRC
ncbi:hypothetical protein FBEOM_5575 [Fusarium beomiforme]|uniref:Uncharacterized protein n=1 Tax=Fusarium beomiforme TaxID=44412 RepID=A0A9P5AMH6_9HYPO|nr:hypothetical protein FBEOM_5575 [Fusarium beomiforme]